MKIVVLQRGWVVVGEYGVDPDHDEIVITNASVIRRWGAAAGLGELRKGPLPATELEPSGTIRCPRAAVILTIDCDREGWKNHDEGEQ